jgi:hypothetical protein
MIEGIIRNEKELRTLIRKDLKKSASEVKFTLTNKELTKEIESFISTEAPSEYPIYAYIDFTIICHVLDVDLITTCHYLTEELLKKYSKELNEVFLHDYKIKY